MLTDVARRANRNLLGAWLANSPAYRVWNLLANFFTPILGARNLLGVTLRDPDLFANGTIRSLAADCLAAARMVSSASSARVRCVRTRSSNNFLVRPARDDLGLGFKVTTLYRYRFHFCVRNANGVRYSTHLCFSNFTTLVSRDCFHRSFFNRTTYRVVDGSLLVFLDCTTNVCRDFLRVIFCDRSLYRIIDGSLLGLSYRTLNCVANCLVGCLFDRALNLVGLCLHDSFLDRSLNGV